MNGKQNIDKVSLASWLTKATILLCLFAFSGCQILPSTSATPARIELTAFVNRGAKRTTSFKLPSSKKILTWLSIRWVSLNCSLFQFARAIKTLLDHSFDVVTSFETRTEVSNLIYTPRYTDEFIPYSPQG